MRRIVIAIGSTLTGLVLLFSWPTSLNRSTAADTTTTPDSSSTSDAATDTSTDTSTDTATEAAPDTTTDASPGTDADATDAPTDTSTTDTSGSTAASGTYTGDSVSTRFGPVQVQITVTDGALTSSEAIDYPDANPKDQQINGYAIPVLNAEAVEAQGSSIQMVSGATYTSDAYITSLQSALDQAGL